MTDEKKARTALDAYVGHWPNCSRYPRAERVPDGWTKEQIAEAWDLRKCTCGQDAAIDAYRLAIRAVALAEPRQTVNEGHYERLWRDEQEAGKVIRRERDEALRELERVKAPASATDPRCACGHVEEAHLPDGRCIEWIDVPGMRSCGCERFRVKTIARETRMFPVLWQGDRAFIASLEARQCPRHVPWAFVAPHEEQAQRNHDQTLERLAERGGLSPTELLAVVTGRSWTQVRLGDVNALPELLQLLAAWQAMQ